MLKTVEMTVDFRRPPHSPSWTALWLQWSHSDSWEPPSLRTWSGTYIVKKAQQRLYFLHQLRKFNLPQELLKQFYSTIIESVLCTSITVWFSSATKSDLRRLRRVVRTAERIIGTTLSTLQELHSSRVSKRADKITLDPHIQNTPSLNYYRLIDATELWAPERPDTETVSSLRQSISWTLDIKRGTHNTTYSSHILIFISICTFHTCIYIHTLSIYCVFAILYIVYLYIILYYLCPVILLHCGASVTITHSSYV